MDDDHPWSMIDDGVVLQKNGAVSCRHPMSLKSGD